MRKAWFVAMVALGGALGCLDRDPAEPGPTTGTPELYPARAWIETGASLTMGTTFQSRFTMSSSDPGVASFDGTVVHAHRPGTATLEALFPTGRRSSLITVVAPGQALRAELVDEGLSDASLLGVWSADQQNIFAVGTIGVILRSTDAGMTWSRMESATTANLTAVWGSSVNDVFAVGAVGSEGVIVHWDGNSWQRQPSPPVEALLDVFGLGPNQVYAVGVGAALAYDGQSWTRMEGDVGGTELWSVWGVSPTELFAVGQNGVALRWDGVRWRRLPSPTSFVLFGLWGTAANDFYAVGIRGTVVHHDGIGWDTVAVPSKADFFAIGGTSKNNIMIVGNGGAVLSFNGVAWTQAPQGASIENLRAISFDSSGVVRVAGWSGTVIERATASWRNLITAPILLSSTVAADGLVYAVGTGGAVFRYRGGRPEYVPVPSRRDLYGITRTSTGALIIVGDTGTVLSSSDGIAWQAEGVGTNVLLRSIWADRTDPNAVFAVGAGGTILRRIGGQWSPMATPNSIFYRHVFGTAPNDVFAVGDSGTVDHFDGQRWLRMKTPTGTRLRGIWGTRSDDLIAVGELGVAIRFDGRTWYSLFTGTAKELRAVAGTGPTDIYAVGEEGTALRFDGSQWLPLTLPRPAFFLGLHLDAAGELTAVGTNRTALRLLR